MGLFQEQKASSRKIKVEKAVSSKIEDNPCEVESWKVQGTRSIARKAERLKARNSKSSRVTNFFTKRHLLREHFLL